MIGFYFCMIHLIISFLIFILVRKKVLKVDSVMFAIVLCIPVWGALLTVFVTMLVNSGKSGNRRKDIEARNDSDLDRKYMPTAIGESENIVPLEDALIMDNSSVRRSVMMDVLMQDTKDYIPVLNQARMNDDVEVVHYATTAMASLSKEFELKLQDYSTQYAENPRKEGLLDEYIDFLYQYIMSGMISGQFLQIQQNTYQQLLAEKVNVDHTPENIAELAKSFLDTKEYINADMAISLLEKDFPEDERGFLLRFRYYFETGEGEKIREMINRVSTSGGFYSKKIREVVSFWTQEGRIKAI